MLRSFVSKTYNNNFQKEKKSTNIFHNFFGIISRMTSLKFPHILLTIYIVPESCAKILLFIKFSQQFPYRNSCKVTYLCYFMRQSVKEDSSLQKKIFANISKYENKLNNIIFDHFWFPSKHHKIVFE